MPQSDWSNLGPLESTEAEGRIREQAVAVIPTTRGLSMQTLPLAVCAELLANINEESESELGASPIDAVLAAGNDAGAQQITNIADATDDADVPSLGQVKALPAKLAIEDVEHPVAVEVNRLKFGRSFAATTFDTGAVAVDVDVLEGYTEHQDTTPVIVAGVLTLDRLAGPWYGPVPGGAAVTSVVFSNAPTDGSKAVYNVEWAADGTLRAFDSANVVWAEGVAPTLATTAAHYSLLRFTGPLAGGRYLGELRLADYVAL